MLNFVAVIGIFLSCSTTKQSQQPNSNTYKTTKIDTVPSEFLESLLKNYPQYFDYVEKNRKDLNVQIIYTQINRDKKGMADLQHHYFNVDADKYFYPASTVKLPIVLLALQKLNELKDKGIDRNTTMLTETSFSGQSAVYNDPTTRDGRPSIAHYIKKILLVSDNDAFNRLYEFLGQDYINAEMKKKGYADVQILHRLNIFLTEAENRRTNPVKFYDGNNSLLYEQPEQNNTTKYAARKDSLGKGYYSGGKLKNTAMDFSKKNRISLEDLHKVLISLLFPDKVKAGERFNISEDDRLFVLKYMSEYPTESIYPPYVADTLNYWPAYCKFIFFGAERTKPDANIRMFSKSGDAYGHMLDVAYVVDFKNKIEFFVSALIYCNSDGILNDDKYDYDSIGKPFMKNLGKVLYDYELKRKYKNKPDLSPLLFEYDK
ncbi:MAG: serine hydrolase [Ferruginibacter sp.]